MLAVASPACTQSLSLAFLCLGVGISKALCIWNYVHGIFPLVSC